MARLRTALFYCGYVLLWSAVITGGGALVGAILFPLIGSLARVEMSLAAMALSGARQIGFLTFIWAVGIAIVMAFQRAHHVRHAAGPRIAPGAEAQRPPAAPISSAENEG